MEARWARSQAGAQNLFKISLSNGYPLTRPRSSFLRKQESSDFRRLDKQKALDDQTFVCCKAPPAFAGMTLRGKVWRF